ncbi:MAG: tripartite tricarboxylate transporter substrate binding protein, partial [Betaproteobacteria bacterium]|nr:tripartite tricarboxylate transporter substrate binding protein [Betaproteobacteria bacterium]
MIDSRARRLWVQSGLVTGLAATLPGLALAQSAFPNRPLKMIVPWTPGQATDLVGRIAAQEISKVLGQPVVVDNKAGAGGIIGTD